MEEGGEQDQRVSTSEGRVRRPCARSDKWTVQRGSPCDLTHQLFRELAPQAPTVDPALTRDLTHPLSREQVPQASAVLSR